MERDLDIYKQSGHISQALQDINNTKLKSRSLVKRFNEKEVRQYIADMRSQIVCLAKSDILSLKHLLELFGVQYIEAKNEAELLCSQMCKEGLVDAVMSSDSDVMACQCPISLIYVYGEELYEIRLENILKKLNLSSNEWVDLCIMCGTDFNPNLHKIGPIKSYDLIRRYSDIETIGSNNFDITPLNHIRVRELFGFNVPLECAYEVKDVGPIMIDDLLRLIINGKVSMSPSMIKKRVARIMNNRGKDLAEARDI